MVLSWTHFEFWPADGMTNLSLTIQKVVTLKLDLVLKSRRFKAWPSKKSRRFESLLSKKVVALKLYNSTIENQNFKRTSSSFSTPTYISYLFTSLLFIHFPKSNFLKPFHDPFVLLVPSTSNTLFGNENIFLCLSCSPQTAMNENGFTIISMSWCNAIFQWG